MNFAVELKIKSLEKFLTFLKLDNTFKEKNVNFL